MSLSGFDQFRETARFAGPAGPATREELADSATDAGVTEDVTAGAPTTTARQSPCPESEFCAKQLELVGVDVPSGDIDPGAEVFITVRLANHAQAIFATDPDRCDNQANPCQPHGTTAGYCAELITRPEWAPVQEDLICANMATIPPNRKDVTVPLPAPGQEGDLKVATGVELGGSGERTQEIVKTISYREGGSTAPPPPDGDDEDGLLGEVTALVGAISVTLALLVIFVGLAAVS